MSFLITVFYIIVCVLLFALAILVHEFGHFIVALKLGLRVEAFSIGFGPVIWKKKVNGVEYRLSSIPLGGYVSIPDVDPEGTKALEGVREKAGREVAPRTGELANGVEAGREGAHDSSDRFAAASPVDTRTGRIPAWKELLVAVAGPAMNVVLAVVIAVGLSLVPSAKFGEIPAIIGGVLPESPAEKAGIQEGDRIVSVGGHPVSTWTEMQTEVQISGGRTVEFEVERTETTAGREVAPRTGVAGIAGREVAPRTNGECAPRTVKLAVTPKQDEVTGGYYIMAVSTTNHAGAAAWMPNRNPLKQLAWDAGSIFRVLKGLVTPKEAKATSKALGGPVMIAEGLYRQVRRDPWDGIGFLRFLNVNLAVLNLLPIPVLDGGLILFALIAMVFRRRVPDFIVKYLSLTFMVLLMGLMGILILRDGWKSYKIHTYEPEKSVEAGREVAPRTGDNGTQDARD